MLKQIDFILRWLPGVIPAPAAAPSWSTANIARSLGRFQTDHQQPDGADGRHHGTAHLNESCRVRLTTDSQYVRQESPSGSSGWKEKGMDDIQPPTGQERRSRRALDAEVARHQIEWLWVRGHSGHPENERCDELAREAASGKVACRRRRLPAPRQAAHKMKGTARSACAIPGASPPSTPAGASGGAPG